MALATSKPDQQLKGRARFEAQSGKSDHCLRMAVQLEEI